MISNGRKGSVQQKKPRELRLPAIEVRQGPKRTLYSFAIDGKMLSEFTTVSRVRRPEASAIEGYQRPEVLSHIAEIREYLEAGDPMIPNAVVVAFDQRVRFEPASTARTEGPKYTRVGSLVIPVHSDLDDADRPGWIVDGQQRIAAIRAAHIESFPICVVAFITGDEQEQREQFILVNSTKPLPKGLIYELLPMTRAKLPSLLHGRRFPALLLDRLNHDPESPLHGLIRTPTVGTGLIKDNSVLKMLENSLTDGVLYRFRGDDGNMQGDTVSMLHVLHAFWRGLSGLSRRVGHLTAPIPAHARGRHREYRVCDGRDRGPLPQVRDSRRRTVPKRPRTAPRRVPLDRWILGFRSRHPTKVERDPEHPARHPNPCELLARSVQVTGLEPGDGHRPYKVNGVS